jgi:hypothetical protein
MVSHAPVGHVRTDVPQDQEGSGARIPPPAGTPMAPTTAAGQRDEPR